MVACSAAVSRPAAMTASNERVAVGMSPAPEAATARMRSMATFSLAVVDGGGPTRVQPVLAALKASAAANLGGGAPLDEPFAPPGATPNPSSALLRVRGRLPDGRPVTAHAAFFVHGVRVYQATAIGEALPEDAIRTFFDAIKVTP